MGGDTAIGSQRWRHLLFLHWSVPPRALQALLPEPLLVDTFEGGAYVGLLPFMMHDVRPLRRLPPVPTAAAFPETNLRTYVRHPKRGPGIWFFSLDAASTLAVLGARVSFFLPYFRATMSAKVSGDTVDYTSRRRWPGPRPAELHTRYRIGPARGVAAPGTLEHFLVERYRLFSMAPTRHLLTARVRHQPYALRDATVEHLDESLVLAAGLSHPATRTPDLYSPGVDVDILAPEVA